MLKAGDKVKVRFGMSLPIAYKRGVFSHYSQHGKYGWFRHTKSGKFLKRLAGEFLSD